MAEKTSNRWKSWLPQDHRELSKTVNTLWLDLCNDRKGAEMVLSRMEKEGSLSKEEKAEYRAKWDAMADNIFGFAMQRNFADDSDVQWYIEALKKAGAAEVTADIALAADGILKTGYVLIYLGNIDLKRLNEMIYN